MPRSGWSASRAARPVAAGHGEAGIGRVGLVERPVVEAQPGVEGVVLALGPLQVGDRELARGDVAGPQPGGHLVGVQAGDVGVGHRHSPSLADDRRDDDEVALAGRRVGQRLLRAERRADDVLAQDVLELDRLGGRRDRVGVELGELRVLVEDVVELALEAAELLVGQAEAGQVSDVSDVVAGQSHGPMIAAAGAPGRRAASSVRSLHPSTVGRTGRLAYAECRIRGFTPASAGWHPADDETDEERVQGRAPGSGPIPVVAPAARRASRPSPARRRPTEVRADVELTIPRTHLDGFTAALVGEHGLGVGPVSPDRLTAAFAGAIDRAGGSGSPSVSRSPAGVYTPEYWRFRIEAADSIAQASWPGPASAGRARMSDLVCLQCGTRGRN